MIVVSAGEMRRLDELTIARGTPGYVLMERAGEGATAVLLKRFPDVHGRRVVIVAGRGNNGGDGFVIARLLANKGVRARVVLVGRRQDVKGDAARALAGLEGTSVRLVEVPDESGSSALQDAIAGASVLVDAVFGTGLNAEVTGLYRDVFDRMNAAGIPIFAVDIPSGLNADTGHPFGTAVKACATVTFGFAKIGEVIQPGLRYVGDLTIVDIGIAPEAVVEVNPRVELLEPAAVAERVPRRAPDAHKGSSGHVVIFAGSRGHSGAALLAAHAACRGGAGLTTLAGPASLNAVFSLGVPEVMTAAIADDDGLIRFDRGAVEAILEGKRAVVVGPGLGTHRAAEELVKHLLMVGRPVVIDADGLTCLSKGVDVLKAARSTVVLTPHPGEMARLLGTNIEEVQADRVAMARGFARKHHCVVLLKGARSVIAAADGAVWINPTGNAGMASGGMGDVLAGLIGALLAQGLTAADAACLGTYLHGAVADDIAREQGQLGMRASDIIEALPRGFGRITPDVFPPAFVLPRRGD
jgi:NAD(P)H-hydrate epimerase